MARLDLANKSFSGFYLRNDSSSQSPFSSADQQVHGLVNGKQDFTMTVLDYDSRTGFFLAKGYDIFGHSGIVGSIDGEDVRFRKIYAGKVDLPHDVVPFNEIVYGGTILQPDNVITMGGDYQVANRTPTFNGSWRLDSIN